MLLVTFVDSRGLRWPSLTPKRSRWLLYSIMHLMYGPEGNSYSRTSIKRPPFKRPPSIKRPFFKVPNYFNVSKLQYSIPLLNGQPLLSSQFLKSRGWPLNRGATVLTSLSYSLQTWPATWDDPNFVVYSRRMWTTTGNLSWHLARIRFGPISMIERPVLIRTTVK